MRNNPIIPTQEVIDNRSRLSLFLKVMLIRVLRLEDITPEDIDNDAPLFKEGLGLDSLDALEIVVALEDNFDITIPDEHVGRKAFSSINALTDYVQKMTFKLEENPELCHEI